MLEFGTSQGTGLKNLSPTKVETALKCPEQFRLRYVEKVPEPSSMFLTSGSVVHAVLEKALKDVVVGSRLPSAADLDDFFITTWNDLVTEEEGKDRFIGWETDHEQTHDQVHDECRALIPFALLNVLPKLKPKMIEHDVKYTYQTSVGEVLVWGKLDLLEEGFLLSDWKTTRKVSYTAGRQPGAGLVYYGRFVAELAKTTGMVTARKIFLIRGEKPSVEVKKFMISPQMIEKFAMDVNVVWNMVAKGYYPTNPEGWHCDKRYCSFWGPCQGELS
jgi:CRISPR/Cas system-associated exonuclease Cas4 (RecB family)